MNSKSAPNLGAVFLCKKLVYLRFEEKKNIKFFYLPILGNTIYNFIKPL